MASSTLNGVDDGHVRVELKQPLRLSEAITSVFWFRAERLRTDTVLFGIPNANPDWTTPVFGLSAKGGHVVYGQFGAKGGIGRTSCVFLRARDTAKSDKGASVTSSGRG